MLSNKNRVSNINKYGALLKTKFLILFCLFFFLSLTSCTTLSTLFKKNKISHQEKINIPGSGTLVRELSDDFEESNWIFKSDNNGGISNNLKWYGSFRGAPNTIVREKSPPGGIKNEFYSLKISTINTWHNEEVNQSDLISSQHKDFKIERKNNPSVVARVYLSHQNKSLKKWSSFALRLSAKDKNLTYYPSLWLYYKDTDNSQNYKWQVTVRLGDGTIEDKTLFDINKEGWYTIGLSFDENGYVHYFLKEGVGDLNYTDKIYSSTQFPNGNTIKMDELLYHFFSIGGSKSELPTLTFWIDHINFYLKY